ncbi:MAG: SBBP repeat-containing protein [Bacteroidota bacterium]
MKKSLKIKWVIILSLFVCSAIEATSQTNFIYGKQFGSDKDGVAYNPVIDQYGNVYIAGKTEGVLSGRNFGKSDGFVSKFDSVGNIIWTKQFGTSEEDGFFRLAIDQMGSLYATGYTKGVISEKNFGKEDIMVVKFDTSGTIEWQKQYGTDSTDVGNSIYVDIQGNIYVTGMTKGAMGKSSYSKADCIVLKLDNKGNMIWINQFGTSNDDDCVGITGDAESKIYVCGYTLGDLAGKNEGICDAFIGKFTDKGEQVKLFQFGTKELDLATGINLDNENNIYLGGTTLIKYGGQQQGENYGFLSKLNENFEIIWTQKIGINLGYYINGIAFNEQETENIVLSGCQNWPACQSFIQMYNKDGSLLWMNNFAAIGKNGGTCGKGVCVDNKGNIYHTGMTGGNLFKSIDKPEGHDIFLIKLFMDNSQINNSK